MCCSIYTDVMTCFNYKSQLIPLRLNTPQVARSEPMLPSGTPWTPDLWPGAGHAQQEVSVRVQTYMTNSSLWNEVAFERLGWIFFSSSLKGFDARRQLPLHLVHPGGDFRAEIEEKRSEWSSLKWKSSKSRIIEHGFVCLRIFWIKWLLTWKVLMRELCQQKIVSKMNITFGPSSCKEKNNMRNKKNSDNTKVQKCGGASEWQWNEK